MSWWDFSSANLSQSLLHGAIQQVLINPRLSDPVASYAGSSMSHIRHMESDVLFAKCSCIASAALRTSIWRGPTPRAPTTSGRPASARDRCRRIHSVAIRCVARSKWASWRAVWRKAAPARPPKPTGTTPAERFQRAVRIKHFDADAGPRVDIVERLMGCALSEVGCGGPRYHHAALSAGSASAKLRR